MRTYYGTAAMHSVSRIVIALAIAVAFQLCPIVSQGQVRQEVLSLRLQNLEQQILAGDSNAVGGFWASLMGKQPLVEAVEGDSDHSLVTFLWRGGEKTKRVLLIGGLPDARLHKPLTRLSNTDIWYRTERMHNKTRMTYAFHVNAPVENYKSVDELAASMMKFPPKSDPQNPNRSLIFSVLELPLSPQQPWSKGNANAPRGKQVNCEIASRVLMAKRHVTVYTPAGYDIGRTPCNLLVFFDAETYTNKILIPTPTILDNLISSKSIPPTVAVFIKNLPQPDARGEELACSDNFSRFVATELVPWVRRRYRVSSEPSLTAICGVSLGGLAAAHCGLKHSAVFGNVLSQSGTFSYSPGYVTKIPEYDTATGWLTREFVKSDKLPLRFYLEVGLFERFAGVDPVLEHRRLRDVLESKGYPVVYSEFYGGHDYICWRGSLADGLIALFGNTEDVPELSQKSSPTDNDGRDVSKSERQRDS